MKTGFRFWRALDLFFRNESWFQVSVFGNNNVEGSESGFEGREQLLDPEEDVRISGFGVRISSFGVRFLKKDFLERRH